MTLNHINHIGLKMDVCACKPKQSKVRLRQNAQQHDTGIAPMVLQTLLPLHC